MRYNFTFPEALSKTFYFKSFSILLFILYCSCYIQAQPLSVTVTTTPTCNHDGTATANVTGGIPPYSYVWSGGSGFINQFTQTITALRGGWYLVYVTDALGNIDYGFGNITPAIQFWPNVIPDTCLHGVGQIQLVQLSGASPFSFLWSNGDTTQNANNLLSGFYDVTVTDGNGCTTTAVEIRDSGGYETYVDNVAPFNVSISTTPASCLNGTATASVTGGTPPYSYLWNTLPIQISQTATALNGNHYYNVIVTDNAGCTGTYYAFTGVNTNLSGNTNITLDTCNRNIATAIAFGIAGSPPYSYQWDTGDTTSAISNLHWGQYAVTITDNQGCEHQTYANIWSYSPVQFSYSTIQPSCTMPTGSIILNVTGGVSPYTYFWQTNPVQLTTTADSLDAGNYNVVVTDVNGCTAGGTTTLNDNSNLQIAVASTPDVCNTNTGTASVTVAGGQAPFNYQWSNSVATATINNLSYNWYTVTVTDAANCVRKKKVFVGDDNLLSLGFNTTNASCIFTNDGNATVNVSGGNAPYTYQWNNNTANQTATSLAPGYIGVTVTDANGCVEHSYVHIGYDSILPCANIIEGTVYNDANVNCIYDAGDHGIANAFIHCNGYKFSDVAGNYQFIVPNGTYPTEQVYPPFWFDLNCPLIPYQNTVTGGQTITNDFADIGDATDIALDNYVSTPAVPGFNFSQWIQVTNQGTTNISNPVLKIKHDSLITFISSSPAASAYSLADRTITFNLNSLYSNSGNQHVLINYSLPSNIPIGTQLSFIDSVFPFVGDTVIYNNYGNQIIPVVGPYDPNLTEVTPQGSTAAGYISTADSELTYLIRFQNTGNYPAQNVMIKTQIDNDLDLRTFKKGVGTFPYDVEISPSGIATFTMQNIFLPDSISNEPASHGFVAFKIKQKPQLNSGTQITSNAGIYFDYNTPVVTNNVINTITGIETHNVSSNSLVIVPNPSGGMVNALYDLNQAADVKIVLYSILGEVINTWIFSQQERGVHDLQIVNSNNLLAKGIYLLSIKINNTVITKKIVRM